MTSLTIPFPLSSPLRRADRLRSCSSSREGGAGYSLPAFIAKIQGELRIPVRCSHARLCGLSLSEFTPRQKLPGNPRGYLANRPKPFGFSSSPFVFRLRHEDHSGGRILSCVTKRMERVPCLP